MDPGPADLPPPGEAFDPRRVLFGDVDGDGLDDLVYVQPGGSPSGSTRAATAGASPIAIDGTPPVDRLDGVRLADMLGSGTAGHPVEHRAAGAAAPARYQFLDLTGGVEAVSARPDGQPHGRGDPRPVRALDRVLPGRRADAATRWQTPLPFPVQVVDRVEVIDEISGGKLTTEYRYHHGYWDGAEREFRGFGLVEQLDTEVFEDYHAAGLDVTSTPFASVAERHFSAATADQDLVPPGPGRRRVRRAPRSRLQPPSTGPTTRRSGPLGGHRCSCCKRCPPRHRARRPAGAARQILRTELYALDGTDRQDRPFTVTESSTGSARKVRRSPATAAAADLLPASRRRSAPLSGSAATTR